jgi:hypothetical protein
MTEAGFILSSSEAASGGDRRKEKLLHRKSERLNSDEK